MRSRNRNHFCATHKWWVDSPPVARLLVVVLIHDCCCYFRICYSIYFLFYTISFPYVFDLHALHNFIISCLGTFYNQRPNLCCLMTQLRLHLFDGFALHTASLVSNTPYYYNRLNFPKTYHPRLTIHNT